MADSWFDLMKGVIAALKGDATIFAIVGNNVFSDVPQNETFPYIAISIQSSPSDTKTSTGMLHTLQISAFSRKDKSPEEATDIRKAVYNLLHRQESAITLDSGTLVSMLFSGVSFARKELDGVTWQATMQFDVLICE